MHVRFLSDTIVDKILPLASEYMITSLIVKSEEYLITKYFSSPRIATPDFDQLMTFAWYCATYDMANLWVKVNDDLSLRQSSVIQNHKLFEKFPDELKCKMYMKRINFLEKICAEVASQLESNRSSSNYTPFDNAIRRLRTWRYTIHIFFIGRFRFFEN